MEISFDTSVGTVSIERGIPPVKSSSSLPLGEEGIPLLGETLCLPQERSSPVRLTGEWD